MSLDYYEADDFDGFSDHEEPQMYVDDDISEDHSRHYDDEASETETGSDDEHKAYTGFVDDEASEADSDLGSEETFEPNDVNIPSTLHQFNKLPLELREMIWKTFCPDLSTHPRVYELKFDGKYLQFAAHVEDQVTPLRTVLAIHRESRALGHKFAPNLIQLPDGLGVAPCHMERDIVFVDWVFDHRYCPGSAELDILGRAAPGMQNLAFMAGVTFFDGGADLDRLYSIKNVFIGHEAEDVPTRGLTWCVSDKSQTYHVVHQEDMGSGIAEDVDILFCWPNPDKYGEAGERSFSSRNFASLQFDQEGSTVDAEGNRISDEPTSHEMVSAWGWDIARLREWLDPLHEMDQPSADQSRSGSSELETTEEDNERAGQTGRELQHKEEGRDDEDEEGKGEQSSPPRPQRISVWPFTRFMFDGVDRLVAMKAWQKPWDEWESDRDHDGSVMGWSDTGSPDSLNGFIAFDDTIDPETDEEEGNDEEEEASSQSEDELGPTSRAAPRQYLVLDSEDEEESSTETGEPSRMRPHNRVVVDLADTSEVEDDEGDAAPQRAGGPSRRVRARPIPVDSEDDDDGDLPQPTRAGSRRAAISLSDSDDDNEGVGAEEKGRDTVENEESSSEEEEDGSDEEPAPPPRMSLAKRLRLEAAQARAALHTDDSEDEDQDGDGGASEEEENTSGGDEMVMGMAEEDEEEGEEPW